MRKCGHIGDKLPVVVDHPQEGMKLTHVVWCKSPLDVVNFGWCYMNALTINVVVDCGLPDVFFSPMSFSLSLLSTASTFCKCSSSVVPVTKMSLR